MQWVYKGGGPHPAYYKASILKYRRGSGSGKVLTIRPSPEQMQAAGASEELQAPLLAAAKCAWEALEAAFSAGAEETGMTVSQLAMMDAKVRVVEHLWFEPAGNSERTRSTCD